MPNSVSLLLFLTVLGLDQLTKAVALAELADGQLVPVTSFFNLVLVWNPGVSFGMLQEMGPSGPLLLAGLTVVIAIALVVWLVREHHALPRAALVLVLAGALGNLADRLRFGAVVDFLDFHLAGYHWPAFNIADSAIVIGAVMLVLDGLVTPRSRVPHVRESR